MTKTFDAIFEQGVLRPLAPLHGLTEHTKVRVSISDESAPHPLLEYCGTIPDEDTKEIEKTIEDEFEKVNPDDWENDVALDTSAAVKLLNDPILASAFLARVGKVYLPAIAIGELLYGALNSVRHEINVPRYQEFINHCLFLPISRATTDLYPRLRRELKLTGFPIPDADIWIAASAIENSLPLVTTDKHFSFIKRLALFALISPA